MASNNNTKLMAIMLVLLVGFLSVNVSEAASELVKRVCEQSNDNGYCLAAFGSDPRSDSLGLHGLGILSIQMNIIAAQDALDKFPDLRKNVTDEVGQRRLAVCQSDFETALKKFNEAFSVADKKAYSEAKNLVSDGGNSVFDCRTAYKWGDPVADPPVSADIQKITNNIVRVINTVLDMLIGK